MKNCARIASRHVCSEHPFLVYSHTLGMLAETDTFSDAESVLKKQVSECHERAKETDAMIFRWELDHWALCGSLYGDAPVDAMVPLRSL